MELSIEEAKVLAIYLELFNRPYNLEDGVLKRHVEAQNVCYMVGCLDGHLGEQEFIFSDNGPFSKSLQDTLNSLDQKDEAIKTFYQDYNKIHNKEYDNYEQQLSVLLKEYLSEMEILKFSLMCYLFSGVVSQDKGSELIASMIYFYRNVFPNGEFLTIAKGLECFGYNTDRHLMEQIWRDLISIRICKINVRKYNKKEKILKHQDFCY